MHRQNVFHGAAFDAAAAQQQIFRPDIIGDRRAMGVGIDQAFQCDALRRIHLGVVIFEGAFKSRRVQHPLRASAAFLPIQ